MTAIHRFWKVLTVKTFINHNQLKKYSILLGSFIGTEMKRNETGMTVETTNFD